jgi:hypothetical protein
MASETLFLSPIASIRAFGAIIPAILDEDPEGARAALIYATRLAGHLQEWSDYPFQGPDAALNKIARLVRERTATTALTHHDIMMLTNAIFEAHRIAPFSDLQEQSPEVRCFNTASDLIEDTWRDNLR